jgi:hypothetical protein
MTPVTFQGLLARHSRLYHGEPAQLHIRIDYRDWPQGLTEMAHHLLMADKETVAISRLRKNCTPLV